MSATRTAIVTLVGVGCVAAAGVGGFFAQRLSSNQTQAAGAPISAPATPAPAREAVKGTGTAPVLAPVERPADIESRVPERSPSVDDTRATTGPAATSTPKPSQKPVPVGPTSSSDPALPAVEPAVTLSASVSAPPEPAPATASAEISVEPAENAKVHFDELTLKGDAVIGIRLDTPLTTETARVEDRVSARVTRDVTVEGRVAIPSGARLEGTVTMVERGGKFRERARLGVRFHAVVLNDNTRVAIETETIFRDGDSPTKDATSKVGASAVIGGILGAVIGGKKGVAIGTAAGAVGGTAAVMASGPNDAPLAAGTPLTVRLVSPVTILVARDQ